MKTELKNRSEIIDLLDKYSRFLEKHGYLDSDYKSEPPFAIDEFLRLNPLLSNKGEGKTAEDCLFEFASMEERIHGYKIETVRKAIHEYASQTSSEEVEKLKGEKDYFETAFKVSQVDLGILDNKVKELKGDLVSMERICSRAQDNNEELLQENYKLKGEYWKGFDYACELLDELYAKTHPHPYNIADCLKMKVNRLNQVRKNEPIKELESTPNMGDGDVQILINALNEIINEDEDSDFSDLSYTCKTAIDEYDKSCLSSKVEMTSKEIEAHIWFELVNSEKNVDFVDWLFKTFNITYASFPKVGKVEKNCQQIHLDSFLEAFMGLNVDMRDERNKAAYTKIEEQIKFLIYVAFLEPTEQISKAENKAN